MTARRAFDAYYTPPELAEAMVVRLLTRGYLQPYHVVWEPHVGDGAFARALVRRGLRVIASDLNPDAPGVLTSGVLAPEHAHDAQAGPPYLAELPLGWRPDFVVGNPPFADEVVHACGRCQGRGYTRRGRRSAAGLGPCSACEGMRCPACCYTGQAIDPCKACKAEGWLLTHPTVVLDHVRAALEVARVGAAFLLRLNFLATEDRAEAVRALHASCPVSPRPSFTGDGATDNHDYIMGVWLRDPAAYARWPFDPLFWTPAKRPRSTRALDLVEQQQAT